MTISSTSRQSGPYTGNGVAGTFAYDFTVFNTAELKVIVTNTLGVDSLLVLDTDYTAILNADQSINPGGRITLLAGPLTTGYRLIIISNVQALQLIDITNLGNFYPTVINQALDKVTVLTQQIINDAGKVLHLPDSFIGSASIPGTGLANKLLGFDVNGDVALFTDPAVVDVSIVLGRVTALEAFETSVTPTISWLSLLTTTGTAPNYVLTPSPAITSYATNTKYRVKFHATGAGADQINVSGLGNKALKQYDATGTKVACVPVSGQVTDIEYDGTDFVVIDRLPPAIPNQTSKILPITASVGSNALTCTLNPTTLDFRSSSLTSGTVNTRDVAAAISVVVPSGATLGTVSAQISRVALIAIDNAGTIELAVINLAGGVNLDETTLISTTTISAGATSASVAYSTTGRSNVPFRVVGYVESTQATAGTWASAPSTIQGVGGQALATLSGIGFGQTWQSLAVGSTRISGTTYYNTTGKPISVLASVNASSGSTVVVGGVTIYNLTNASFQTVNFIVPNGSSYVITAPTQIVSWSELR